MDTHASARRCDDRTPSRPMLSTALFSGASWIALLALAAPAHAQKRELSTDRPDQTESPYSVDAGHVQVESELVSHAVTHEAGVTVRETHLMNMNVRVGLTERVDAQLVLLPFVMVRTEDSAGSSSSVEGFGDTAVRAKINLIGNDSGDFALGLLPFVTLPTASEEALRVPRVEYGLAVPMGFALPADFALGVMEQVDLVAGERNDYVVELTQTITIGRALVGDLGAFTELASSLSFEGGTDASLELHGGLTYGATDDIQLDAGVFGTLLGQGEDVRGFLGLTVRV